MDIGICCLRVVTPLWIDDEPVIGVNISRFVHGMVSGTETPRWIPTCAAMQRGMILRAGREGKVHQVGDGRLSFAARRRPHGGLKRELLVSHLHRQRPPHRQHNRRWILPNR